MSGASLIIFEIFAGIAFLTILGCVIAVVMTRIFGTPDKQAQLTELLNQRYAKGELSREQYLQMRRDIGLPEQPAAPRRPTSPTAPA